MPRSWRSPPPSLGPYGAAGSTVANETGSQYARSDMNRRTKILIGTLVSGLCLAGARADERRFTYTYEPELLPQGGMEFEQWVTLRTQRTRGGSVQQGNYNLWELREELEYGVTDN